MARVFIGTMYSNENDFDECVKSINNQKFVSIDHYVVQGLREYDAHENLYEKWENEKESFDAFVKVDADTILRDDTIIFNCVEELKESIDKGFTSLQCPLYDHFLEGPIYGLNCYSRLVKFDKPKSRIFCDRMIENNITKVIRSNNDTKRSNLLISGDHCKNASDYQSFMWGYHRGSKSSNEVYDRLISSIKIKNTKQKIIAKIGFETGIKEKKELSYTDLNFTQIFNEATRGKI